jgi:putative membrane protein
MVERLPFLNACLNTASALFLTAGFILIRLKKVSLHRACMLSAFALSTLFLASYLYYHAHAGVIRYTGQGFLRAAYFALLTSHSILAAVIVPLILRTLYLAVTVRFEDHRRWARWTLPLWFYVSVTGVVIYEMLY